MTEFNFNGVNAAEERDFTSEYLKPGMYVCRPISAVFKEYKTGTPYMEVEFRSFSKNPEFNDKMVKEKFALTLKNMPRIVYLHQGFYGKPIAKSFSSAEDIVAYFKLVFESDKAKQIKKPIIVAGTMNEKGLIYSNLPFTSYVVDEKDFVEGKFEEGSEIYKRNLKLPKVNFDTPKSNDDFVNTKPSMFDYSKDEVEEKNDLDPPF